MMNEWILSSSALIAAVLLGRVLLRGRISLRLQYALWLVVLVRLLLPVQLFTSDFGAGSMAQTVDVAQPVRQVYASAREDDYERDYDIAYSQVVAEYQARLQTPDPVIVEREAQTRAEQKQELDLKQLLYGLWFAGMAVMTAVIVACNVHFGLHLKRRRWEYPAADCLLSVYVTEAVPTPCIFGLFHPAIYLTPEAAGDEGVRNHVLTHELTHYRHGDHIWSVLRSVCLVLHWYNPLVWMAAKVSRADAELACDEGALAKLGEEHRADYGRTLIGLTCAAPIGDLFVTATTMTGSAGSIRERIKLLMKRPRNTVLALTAVVLIGTIIVGCAFAGAPETTEPMELTQAQIDQVNMAFDTFLDGSGDSANPVLNPITCFFTSYYEDVRELKLAAFLRYFPGGEEADETEFALLKQTDNFPFTGVETLAEMPVPIHRYSVESINAVLDRYAGITHEELQEREKNTGELIYLPETACYYNFTSDFGPGIFHCGGGTIYEDRVELYAENTLLTLTETDDGYKIVSHMPLETIDPVEEQPQFGTVAYFDDLLNPDMYRSEADWYPQALTSYYDSPAGIDLFQLFYSGIPGADNTLSESERAFLEDQPGYEPDFDLVRIPAREMDRVLAEFFGIPLDETARIGLGNFIYNPQSGCYYHSHTDTNLGFCTVTSCEEQTTGDWRVRYTSDLGEAVVTLRQRDGKWQIVSNLPVETSSLLRSDGMIVFPGTEWFMTEEEVLSALGVSREECWDWERTSGEGMTANSFTVRHADAFGVPMELCFTFRSFWDDVEPVLTEVYGHFDDQADFETVRALYTQVLGETDHQNTPGIEETWYSEATFRDLFAQEGNEILCSRVTTDAAILDLPASWVNWVDGGSMAINWHTELPLSVDQAAEVRALFGEYGDLAAREALTRLWCDWTGFSENEFVDIFVPEILDIVQTAEESFMVYYRRPGGEQLYAAEVMPHEDGWAVTANRLVISRPDGARDLTDEEIDRVRAAFKPDIYDEELGEGRANPLACLVNDYYDDVTKLDRSELLAYFPGSTDATEQEFELLQAKYPEFFGDWTWEGMPIPIHVYDPKVVNNTLRRYADIRWEDLAWDEDLHYLEETGCFYNYTSDFGLYGFHCAGGWVTEDGAVLLSSSSALYLTERGGEYYIQAHLPAMVFQTGSQPMIPAELSDEDAVKAVAEAFLTAYGENIYLNTDNEYDHLTVLAADEDATAFYGNGQSVPMLDFRNNIQNVREMEDYWKQARQEQGITRHNFEAECHFDSITFDGDIATVTVGYAMSFTYDDQPGITSGLRDDYRLQLVRVDGTWLIADAAEIGG